jgi:hypothetical protein
MERALFSWTRTRRNRLVREALVAYGKITNDKRASILRTVVMATRVNDSGCDAHFLSPIRWNVFPRALGSKQQVATSPTLHREPFKLASVCRKQ